jgi:hypothetical protein
MGLDAETIFQQGQIRIEFAQQIGEEAIIFKRHDDARLVGRGPGATALARSGLPAYACQIPFSIAARMRCSGA